MPQGKKGVTKDAKKAQKKAVRIAKSKGDISKKGRRNIKPKATSSTKVIEDIRMEARARVYNDIEDMFAKKVLGNHGKLTIIKSGRE